MVAQWGALSGDDVLAAEILDLLLHHGHTLMIQGESYRPKQKRKAGLLGSRKPEACSARSQSRGERPEKKPASSRTRPHDSPK
jgi:hypothetical protein